MSTRTPVRPARRFLRWSALGTLTLLAACGQAPRGPSLAGAPAAMSALDAPNTVSGAVYTTTHIAYDPAGSCLNGPAGVDPVNCNIYQEKDDVWLSGGPARPNGSNTLEAGSYFFSILVPGGQLDPRDGTAKNLSDDYDTYQNRTFTFDGSGISAYAGTHVLDSGKLRAFPYADTTNQGGEYILAVCSLAAGYDKVDPSQCKYDAFKVRKGDDPQPQFVVANLSGFKYLDANLDGIRNVPSSAPLAGWTVTLSCDGTDTTYTTDAAGGWSESLTLPFDAGTTICTVTEQQIAGWTQTGNLANESSSSDPVTTSTLNADKTYTVVIGHSADSTVTELNFGNVPLSQLGGQKLYGSSATGIAGWKVSLSGTTAAGTPVSATTTTGAAGNYSFGNLLPGSYTVTESFPSTNPTGSKWVALSAKSYAVAVSVSGVTIQTPVPLQQAAPAFRNVCQVNPGGKTLGFWSNTNGTKAFATISGGLTTLVDLNLRDARGLNFNPATYASHQKWLLGATATNMAYMLSAQMSATKLNTLSTPRYTDPGVTVSSAAVGTLTVAELIQRANDSLKAPAGTLGTPNDIVNTSAPSAARTSQDGLQKLLNVVNNSGETTPVYFNQPDGTRCAPINASTVWLP